MDDRSTPIMRGEKRDHCTPMKQSQKATVRHVACSDKPDCIIANIMPADMPMKAAQALIRTETWTRLG